MVGNIGLIWVLSTYFGEYFILVGGVSAYLIVGALITLLNMIVRPVLNVITLPLKLFATILAVIVVNGVIIWLIQYVIDNMQTGTVQLTIGGGVIGWIVVAILFGFGNWLMKAILK